MTSSYFSLVPNLKYDKKPISYPFSESDFVIAKNFFKRLRINSDVFDQSQLYDRITIDDGARRLDLISQALYGRPDYDWIIILTNGLINPLFDFPLTSLQLQKQVEKNYNDPYNTIRHYEIIANSEQEELFGRVLYDEGTHVDETFYNTSHKYIFNGSEESAAGRDLAFPVTVYAYEEKLNNDKRNMYALKPALVEPFIDDIRRQTQYKKSSSFLNSKLKQTGK
jgi:hypothetical protein